MRYFPLFLLLLIASCRQEEVPPPSGNANALYDFKTLGGTTWVLAAYHDTVSTTNMTPSDTLVFTDSTHYFYNGVPCTYAYYFYANSQSTHLELYDTPFGDLRAIVPSTIETYGAINGVQFNSLTGVYYMWFERQ